MILEVPELVLTSGELAISALTIGGGLSGAVLMIDYAFDRVKEGHKKGE